MKKIITIVGARPQIIKSAALSRAISRYFSEQLCEVIVHTGQHYDENMSNVFFEEMKIPYPNFNLNVGSGTHASQTARMLEGLEEIFIKESPDAVLVYGDTNSTIAGALAAAKIHVPVIHVEAGLRSFNKAMPEEVNRISCDHMSTLLFTPTSVGLANLEREGFSMDKTAKATIDHPHVHHCGDIMYDNSLYFSEISTEFSTVMKTQELENREFVLMTVHRDSNTDIPENLEAVFNAIIEISEKYTIPFVLPIHPRTRGKIASLKPVLQERIASSNLIKIIDPVGFMDIIALEKNARMIVTDSGGLQKEAFFFKKPCVILRPQTEWIEIVNNGNALLCGADHTEIVRAFERLYTKEDYSYPSFYGDGKAAEFMCEKILEML